MKVGSATRLEHLEARTARENWKEVNGSKTLTLFPQAQHLPLRLRKSACGQEDTSETAFEPMYIHVLTLRCTKMNLRVNASM
jgi:hypothetical protein